MSIGSTNTPIAFMDMMNIIFVDYLDQFAVVFIDDILINYKSQEDHEVNLWKALERIR
jgi:hypothetical protein